MVTCYRLFIGRVGCLLLLSLVTIGRAQAADYVCYDVIRPNQSSILGHCAESKLQACERMLDYAWNSGTAIRVVGWSYDARGSQCHVILSNDTWFDREITAEVLSCPDDEEFDYRNQVCGPPTATLDDLYSLTVAFYTIIVFLVGLIAPFFMV